MLKKYPRVKICGITRPQDGIAAAEAGADAIGLVFYNKSPRAVSITQAQAIVRELPVFMTIVGLFVNATFEEITQILAQVPLDRLQFHGEESSAECEQFGKPYIKALRMKPTIEIDKFAQCYVRASALLIDSYVPNVKGGTGVTFDWEQLPKTLPKPVILAGGLTPENIGQAIRTVKPYAVDVSGGVESTKGIKDANKINAFMQEVFHVYY
jgi:phosphoribosylanthranilate isomerase